MNTLAATTATFLFTDIEGSTRRWETDRAAMSAALARHDVLLRTAIEAAGGTVFKTVGDAFCAVFADPVAALGAAVAAQRALGAEDWGAFGLGVGDAITRHGPDASATFGALRVRMALHSGLAEERGGDYFGPTLNRVARLLAAGHGGQVLLSAMTEGLLSGHLPEDVTLRDLGEHRLKDLARAERVWQVAAEGLAGEHPPIRSLERARHNLPVLPTSLVGREQELVALRALFERCRLVTLLGPGGMGKTRLALQAAAESMEEQPDGAWFVDLAPVTTAGGVALAAATALGVAEEAGRELTDSLLDYLRGRRLLLVLDNCEQVIEAAARLAEAIGRTAPGVTLLATSREALRVPGETTLSLDPLEVPDPQLLAAREDAAAALRDYDATRLFIERAAAVRPDFRVTRANAAAIAAICRQLDGMPLALELAAARMRHMSPELILGQLRDRFRLLTTGSRTALPRQQTLAAAIDWSHALLDEEEQRIFRRLAIFRGGWTMEAAEAICSDDGVDGWRVTDLVTHLVDKSLVTARDTAEGGTRYGMLDSIGAYAAEKLSASGERAVVALKHAEWLRELAERAEGQRMGPESGLWLARLTTEMDNIRAALERGTEGEVSAEVAFDLAANLWWPWSADGGGRDGLMGLQTLMVLRGDEVSGDRRVRLAYCMGSVARSIGNVATARGWFEKALKWAELAADLRMQAWCLNDLAGLAGNESDLEAAESLAMRAVDIKRRLGADWDLGISLMGAAGIATLRGDLVLGRERLIESEQVLRRSGNLVSLAMALCDLAEHDLMAGDAVAASAHIAESVLLAGRLGDVRLLGGVQSQQALHSLLEAQTESARRLLADSIRNLQAADDPTRILCMVLPLAAWTASQCSDHAVAASVLGIRNRHQGGASPIPPQFAERLESDLAQSRAALGEPAYSQAFANGQAMDFEEAITWCLAWLEGGGDPTHV